MLSGGGVSRLFPPGRPVRLSVLAGAGKAFGASDLDALRRAEPQRLFEVFQALCKGKKNANGFLRPCAGRKNAYGVCGVCFKSRETACSALFVRLHQRGYLPIIYRMAKSWARLQSDQGKSAKALIISFCRQLPGEMAVGRGIPLILWYVFGTLEGSWRPLRNGITSFQCHGRLYLQFC